MLTSLVARPAHAAARMSPPHRASTRPPSRSSKAHCHSRSQTRGQYNPAQSFLTNSIAIMRCRGGVLPSSVGGGATHAPPKSQNRTSSSSIGAPTPAPVAAPASSPTPYASSLPRGGLGEGYESAFVGRRHATRRMPAAYRRRRASRPEGRSPSQRGSRTSGLWPAVRRGHARSLV